MGRLRVTVGETALRAEHERLLRTALRRGEKDPESHLGDGLSRSYSEEALVVARETWRRRTVHEHASSAVFSRLLPQLMEAEATLDVKTAVLRMAMDELRHAALCAGVVAALGGDPEVDADLRTEPLPEHPGCTPAEVALRNIMFVGCMSETVSIALLTEERELTTEPLVHRVVDQLAADEVLHAKLGWSYLGDVWTRLADAERERTARYLPIAFGHLERCMLGAMPLGPERSDAIKSEMHALGVLGADDGREIFYETVNSVIVPRLGDAGLPAADAWRNRSAQG